MDVDSFQHDVRDDGNGKVKKKSAICAHLKASPGCRQVYCDNSFSVQCRASLLSKLDVG